jgi:hypothetical protein
MGRNLFAAYPVPEAFSFEHDFFVPYVEQLRLLAISLWATSSTLEFRRISGGRDAAFSRSVKRGRR